MVLAHAALNRTGLLLAADVFNGALTENQVVDGLLTARARIIATAAALATPAAQTAVVTLALNLTMSGIAVDLDFPDVALAAAQPPLHGSHLAAALTDYANTNFPWLTHNHGGHADVVFVLGGGGAADAIGISGDNDGVRIAPAVPAPAWHADWPIVPIAAGHAAAVIGLRRVLIRLARDHALPRPMVLPVNETIDLPVDATPARPIELGDVLTVSGGAITHAALFVLLRVPELAATFSVFDAGDLDITNSNRYFLYAVDCCDLNKAELLLRHAHGNVHIAAHAHDYHQGDAAGAERIIVGADNIAVRWAAQNEAPTWLGIGATSHLFSQVSTHVPGSACAGCIHPRDTTAPEVIPTAAPISGWAGLHLANELLRSPQRSAGIVIESFPLGLGGSHSHFTGQAPPSPRCARSCTAA